MAVSMLAVPLAVASIVLILASSVLLLLKKRRSSTGKACATQRHSVDDGRDVIRVLYGTQTGTAEKFAKQLATQLSERYGEGVAFKAVDIDTYDHASRLGSERLLIYLVATYGDGEPTDNAVEFHTWLEPKADAVFDGDEPELLRVRLFCFQALFCLLLVLLT